MERVEHRQLLRDTDLELVAAERRIRSARLKIAAAERKYDMRLKGPGK